ncbi:MAG: hypothetical protein ACOYN3_01875 [Acidimicrobiia bacterium]
MDSQRRFEGPDIQALLTQVQHECGPDATIIEANKLRSGGIGGFFSRERFEVIVDTSNLPISTTNGADGASSARTPRRITTTPNVWDALSATTDTKSATSHLETAVMSAMAAVDADADVDEAPAATSILELAERRNNEERSLTPEAPKVSTETPAFAEMLGRLAREALANTADAEQDAPFVPFVAPATTPSMPESTRESTAELVATRVAEQPATQTPAEQPATLTSAQPFGIATVGDTAPAVEPATPTMGMNSAPASMPITAPAALQSPIGAALACLGVPEQYVPATHMMGNLRKDLTAALRWLPVADPLPTSQGSVVAVVGNADTAMALAQQIATELGCDAHDIIVASEQAMSDTPSWMHLSDLDAATERRRGWRRRTTPTVVAVAAPLGYDPAAWARPMLDALEPTIAWGVVSADRKPEDVRAWVDRLGGLDTLALTDLDLTVSPASMLRLGIPIARLDGKPADPISWANLLLARLAA